MEVRWEGKSCHERFPSGSLQTHPTKVPGGSFSKLALIEPPLLWPG